MPSKGRERISQTDAMKPNRSKANARSKPDTKAPSQTPPAEGKPPDRPPLPMMATFDDAEALALSQKDPFYLAVFLFQIWLSGLLLRATAEYAEKKNPKERSLQTGEAWRSFLDLFPFAPKKGFGYLLTCLARFAATDDAPGNSLRRALVPLSIERYNPGDPNVHPLPSDGRGIKGEGLAALNHPASVASAKEAQPSALNQHNARRTIMRWCDWVDAAVHLRTHRHWHLAPGCFSPDPEARELAALGNAQRHIAGLDARARLCWLSDFANAAEKYQHSPKWTAVGKAMSDDSDKLWLYADVDSLVIALWPLVKAHNWTYRDLLNVIRPGLKRPNAYPCEREQDFSAYCANVLGLRKQGKGVSARNGKPTGHEIAKRMCPALGGEGKRTANP